MRHARKIYMTALFGPCRGTCTRLDTSIQGDSATGTCKRVRFRFTIPPPFHYVRTALTVVYDPLRPTHDRCVAAHMYVVARWGCSFIMHAHRGFHAVRGMALRMQRVHVAGDDELARVRELATQGVLWCVLG